MRPFLGAQLGEIFQFPAHGRQIFCAGQVEESPVRLAPLHRDQEAPNQDAERNNERVIAIARKTRAVGRKAPAASKKLLGLVEKSLDDDKAENVVAIDLSR